MGFFSDLKAIKDVQIISEGGTAKLSMSQIVNLIINLPDANRNLSSDKYQEVLNIYNKFRKCNTKIQMDKEQYYATCRDIIKEFDKIAPYESYSGLNPFEASFLMKEIRNNKEETSDETIDGNMKENILDSELSNEEKEVVKQILNDSNGRVEKEEAEQFVRLFRLHSAYGKEEFLKEFREWSKELREKKGATGALFPTSFLVGVLNGSKLINEEEVKMLTEENTQAIMEEVKGKSEKE